MAWVNRTNADEVYGISEQELYDEWWESDGMLSFTEWLESQYNALAAENPHGGWVPQERGYFRQMAAQIMYDAQESGEYNQ